MDKENLNEISIALKDEISKFKNDYMVLEKINNGLEKELKKIKEESTNIILSSENIIKENKLLKENLNKSIEDKQKLCHDFEELVKDRESINSNMENLIKDSQKDKQIIKKFAENELKLRSSFDKLMSEKKNDKATIDNLINEKIKIKSNLEIIEDHMYNLKPNYVEEINDSTLHQENDIKTLSNSTQKSSKSYISNVSNDTYVNSYEERYNLTKSFNKLYGISSNSSNDSLNYKYGSYGNTRVYGGKIRNNKVMDSDKTKYVYKSISRNNDKQMQNYVSFNKVFKERSHCSCECHNKEYTKIRVKFKPFDLMSKNNHEFIYWSFFACLEINTIMVILFGLFSVFPE